MRDTFIEKDDAAVIIVGNTFGSFPRCSPF